MLWCEAAQGNNILDAFWFNGTFESVQADWQQWGIERALENGQKSTKRHVTAGLLRDSPYTYKRYMRLASFEPKRLHGKEYPLLATI